MTTLNTKFLPFIGIFLVLLLTIPPMQNVSSFTPSIADNGPAVNQEDDHHDDDDHECDPSFEDCTTDTDGDGTIDWDDDCKDHAGPPENWGCPEGMPPYSGPDDGETWVDDDPDGDGIVGEWDECPNDPAYPPNEVRGCPDTDGDGTADRDDSCPNEAGWDGTGCPEASDVDGDGVPDDQDNCPNTGNPYQEDFNNDGSGDVCTDTDGDGYYDTVDNCPNTSYPNDDVAMGCPPTPVDTDGDGLNDVDDDCPNISGPASNNGCPDAPGDTDGDGLNDVDDDCPNISGPASNNGCPDTGPGDTDGDGFFDDFDQCINEFGGPPVGCPVASDVDGDGVPDVVDNCPNIGNPNQEDFNNDGSGDVCTDTDGDGYNDSFDQCPAEAATASGDGCPDDTEDPWQDFYDGVDYYEAGNYQQAINSFLASLQIFPDDYDTFGYLAASYYELGQFENAIDALKDGLQYHPNDPDYLSFIEFLEQQISGPQDNIPPVVTGPSSVSTTIDTPITFTITASDPDNGPQTPVSFNPQVKPQHGTLQFVEGTQVGNQHDYVYTPNPGYTGQDSFGIMVWDGEANSEITTIYVNIGTVDSDGDGFTDDVDQCPSEYGTVNGCPDSVQPPPQQGKVTINFDEIDTSGGPVSGDVVDNYLAKFGIKAVDEGNSEHRDFTVFQFDRSKGVHAIASSGTNAFFRNFGNEAYSYSLYFDVPLNSFQFTRASYDTSFGGILTSSWNAQAYDSNGNPIGSPVGEGKQSRFGDSPPVVYSFNGPDIAKVTFYRNNVNTNAGIAQVPIDDIILNGGTTGTTTIPIDSEDQWQDYYDGVEYYEAGNYRQAITSFLASLQIFPDDYDTFGYLASSYYELGQWQNGIDILEKGLQYHPNDPDYLSFLEVFQLQLGGTVDSDGDGFTDDVDKCPSEYGTVNGCPETPVGSDVTPPTITVPNNMYLEIPRPEQGTTVTFDDQVFAQDDTDTQPTLVCTPESGSFFYLGETEVRCTATDASGNSDYDSFYVTPHYPPELFLSPLPPHVDQGNTITFSGSLTAGFPITGARIQILDSNDSSGTVIATPTTDSNGEFSESWTAVAKGDGQPYAFYAYVDVPSDAPDHLPDFLVSKAYSVTVSSVQLEPIRVFTDDDVYEEGDSIIVSGFATPGEQIRLGLIDTNENVLADKIITVDSSGSFRDTFYTWSSSASPGEYAVFAVGVIDEGDRWDYSAITFIETVPEIVLTELTLNAPEAYVFIGDVATYTGTLRTIGGQAVSGVPVEILLLLDDRVSTLAKGNTNSNGQFNISWNVNSEGLPPDIVIFAGFRGNQIYDSSSSTAYAILISAPEFNINLDKEVYTVDDQLAVYGSSPAGDQVDIQIANLRGDVIGIQRVTADTNGYYVSWFDLPSSLYSPGVHTATATSSKFGTTASMTFEIEAPIVKETIDIVSQVLYTDQGRRIAVDGVKVLLDVSGRTHTAYSNEQGIATFSSIPLDTQRLVYVMQIDMSDGNSFDLVDGRKFSITSGTVPDTIRSYSYRLNLNDQYSTNYFTYDLTSDMPYSASDSNYIATVFNTQSKVVDFYNKVLNEKPPLIDMYLFEDGSAYYSTAWDTRGYVLSGYGEPRIKISENPSSMMAAVGMEYTHYVQDYSYRNMFGYDTQPRDGNHMGFNNPSTADSWVEGVGTFMPAVIAHSYGMPEAGYYGYQNLETNIIKPSTDYKKWDDVWLDEEYSIATLLWDMYDNNNDGESASLTIKQIWNLIKGYDRFEKYNSEDYMQKYDYTRQLPGNERHIKYFKDFYDYARENSGLSQSEIDNLFSIHGIPNGKTTAGPRI